MAQPNIRISPLAQADLKQLKLALRADFGMKANNEDIASALIHGTSVSQLFGMLLAYNRKQGDAGSGTT
jgi:hypothetical protein